MRLPNETLQNIYRYLAPRDFHAARRTCRLWFLASLDRSLLVQMLKRGGWWSSWLSIRESQNTFQLPEGDEMKLMSKWISRESDLASLSRMAFQEIGFTDFSGLLPGSTLGALHGALFFTASVCGRFLMVTNERTTFVYELGHTCRVPRTEWLIPARMGRNPALGLPRPASMVICPRRVISCSMDTSAGSYIAAFLMEGRTAMTCNIMPGRTREPNQASTDDASLHTESVSAMQNPTNLPSHICTCQEKPGPQAPPLQIGLQSAYKNVCRSDDPPRSIAICPYRNCVAFGCIAGIELH